ncbi:unnamed protein product [Mytilus edulis]|uniref:B box-type domain-containing protein n=1 Tax=Mytilus edulis TaxID=6550 RepID=A0A8S3PT78_MYTED|nr:unnamed protein product [Mytilus edulis]
MAENSPEFCDICHRLDISKPAAEFCPQCGDLLCEVCQNHHKVAKLSNLHQTISLDEYDKLPLFIKNINNKCDDHEGILEFYCKTHDMMCCKRCLISSHKDCNETTLIEDLISMSQLHKTSALDDIEQILEYVEGQFIKKGEPKKTRNKRFAGSIEKTLLQQLSEVEKENHQKMEIVIKDMEERSSKIIQLQRDVALIKESASNLQIFMGIRELKDSVSFEEKHIKSLHCSGSLNIITIECIFEDQLKTFIENIHNLGKIQVKNVESEISFSWVGDKAAQLYIPPQIAQPLAKPIKDIQSKLVHTFKTSTTITGCAMLPTGKILLSDYNYGILKYDKNGGFESRIAITSCSAFSLAVVDAKTVIVSGGGVGRNLYHLDINTETIVKKVDMNNWFCYGVSFQNGSYIVCTHNHGIKIVDTSQGSVTNNSSFPIASGSDCYISSYQNRIVHSNFF